MTNYCTDQWVIVKFPCGSGGKFLSNCLFLFDRVAHWHQQQNTVNYFKQTMLNTQQPSWLKRELNHQWNLNFFSRSYQRNNDLSCKEFNQLVDEQASEYFRHCWSQGLDIVDHWAKPQLPAFWQSAKTVTIDIDDMASYEQLVMSKLYAVEGDSIVSLLDTPASVSTPDNVKYAKQYKNRWQFPLMDLHEFFETEVKLQPWLAPWLNYSIPQEEFVIKLSELLDQTKFINKFEYFEDLYKQRIPREQLIEMHNIWSQANELCAR
jgi:hypothetical protein